MSAKKTGKKAGSGFTDAEKSALKERAAEVKKEKARGKSKKADGEADLRARIAEMDKADRMIAERLHDIVMSAAPDLEPRTWYGMPAYARDGKVVCFFQAASKFKTRYATFGFSDAAHLDEGSMWPTSFAIKELTPGDEARVSALVKRAVTS